jgi:hypothetical protein
MWGRDKVSLVVQLQKEIVDSDVSLSDILRKAKILASLLRNEEFKSWVDAELKGYDSPEDIPNYRKFRPANMGTFAGAFGKVVNNVQIPVSYLPEELREFAEKMEVSHGVKELEASATQAAKNDKLRFPWPPEGIILARDHVRMDDGSVLVEAWKPFTKSQMEGILEQVRNRLLDLLLELQEIDPEVANSEEAIRALPSEKVQNLYQTIIHGGNNVVASGAGFTQTATQNVITGNMQSLHDHFRSLGIPNDALAELDAAITEDGRRPQKQMGEKVKSWLGKMTVKAMDGAWKIGLGTAPMVLKEALFQILRLELTLAACTLRVRINALRL